MTRQQVAFADRFTGLWRHPDFMKLWAGQSVSLFGSVITRDALPLVAILTLTASPAEMGLLTAASAAPVILFGLQAGVWVDRMRRRPLMILADLLRALLLLSIPLAALAGVLRIEQLYIVTVLVAILTLLFDIAYRAYLPALVTHALVVEGNSKLSFTESLAESTGSALAGLLVQVISAPLAILVNALTFIGSSIALALIRAPEERPRPVAHPDMKREIVEGLGLVARTPVLRSLFGVALTGSFFGGFIGPLYALFAVRTLGLSPALLGFVIATGGIGGVMGALFSGRIVRRWGLGSTLLLTSLFSALMVFIIPLASGPPLVGAAFLIAGQVLGDMAMTVYGIHAISLQQTVTPANALGRVNASEHFTVAVAGLLGALLGGFLGQVLGLRVTLAVAAVGKAVSCLWLLPAPVRLLRTHPAANEAS